MKYSDKDYNQLCYYYQYLSQAKATYISCYEGYYSYKLHLSDKYSPDIIDNLINEHYAEWERLVNLFNNMLKAFEDYKKAIRNLYNFKIVLRQHYADFGSIVDLRSNVG